MYNPIWWGVYIGPQQQKQPDGGGPGCMLYPLENCPTQPRIDVRNITLRDLKSTGGILPAGIIRCNETSYFRDFDLEKHDDGRAMHYFCPRDLSKIYINSSEGAIDMSDQSTGSTMLFIQSCTNEKGGNN